MHRSRLLKNRLMPAHKDTDHKGTNNKGRLLLQIARASITEAYTETNNTSENSSEKNSSVNISENWLEEKGACFITLMQNGKLRGCVGTLEVYRSLIEDVKANAQAAAFNDRRFSRLCTGELARTQIEISLLSSMQVINFDNEQSLLNQLQAGVDGVVFEYAKQRSTFLPQVWQQLPSKKSFISQLKQKAGLPSDFWADDIKISRYNVHKWKDSDFDDLPAKHSETPESEVAVSAAPETRVR